MEALRAALKQKRLDLRQSTLALASMRVQQGKRSPPASPKAKGRSASPPLRDQLPEPKAAFSLEAAPTHEQVAPDPQATAVTQMELHVVQVRAERPVTYCSTCL